jgi:REP element-mobilizing transposase RayT
MGRFTRVVAVDVPHRVTQRGNGRRFVLDGDVDRTIYLKLLHENIVLHGVALIGYCLMSNPTHLIAIPHKVDGLSQALKQTHGAVRFLLECGSPIERTRLARAILLLPAGPVAPLGGVALYRAQPGESWFGLGCGAVALVQRSISLRRQRARRLFDAGALT